MDTVVQVHDEAVLITYLETISNLLELGAKIDLQLLAPVLLNALSPRMNTPAATTVLAALDEAVKDPKVATAIGAQNGFEKVIILSCPSHNLCCHFYYNPMAGVKLGRKAI